MISFIESSAGRIAARVQSLGAHFDPDILSLPGGSVMAVVLWAYANTMLSLKREKTVPPAVDAEPCHCTRF